MGELVLGYDGTPDGVDAVVLGRQLCEVLGARAVVATNVSVPAYLEALVPAEAIEAEVESGFGAARERLSGIDCEFRATKRQSAAEALQQLAEERRAGAIVIGSAHRGPVGRVLLGSTGESLLPGAPCAVAVAPRGHGEGEAARLERVGVAVNGTPESEAALEAAVEIAERAGASLVLLAVASPAGYGHLAHPGMASEEMGRAAETHVRGVLEGAAAKVDGRVPAEARALKGEVAHQIVEAADGLDLLAAGSRGYGPMRRVLLGSVSRHLMRSAPCPLLVTPHAAGDDPLHLGA